MIIPTDLRVNDNPHPMGLENGAPFFSWIPVSAERSRKQAGYQILMASSEENISGERGDLWDSGRVKSGLTQLIPYGGKPLKSTREYWWKARLWDDSGAPSPWSASGRFSADLLSASDWKASWIGRGPEREPQLKFTTVNDLAEIEKIRGPIPVDENSTLLRREFSISGPARRAVVYVCGLGFYCLYVNGRRLGRNVLTPSKTEYRKQVLYDAYDVTGFLQEGKNALGLMLGNGWYNPLKEVWDWRMQWHGSKKAILQLHAELADGSEKIIVTDGAWKTSVGPVQTHCLYNGESYDARLEQPGWDRPGFNDASWKPANEVEAPGGVLRFHSVEPVQVTQTIRPENMWEVEPGVWIFDMGQNFSGFTRIRVSGARGTQVRLRHAENMHPDGSLDVTTNMNARNTDVYVLKGEGEEVFEPHFVYHGFQYVEVALWPGAPALDSIEGRVIHSGCRQTGSFRCSNELINHVHHCTVWSQRSNMMGLPTDDNQRDERLGWMGDGHLTAEEFMCNFEPARFYRKWLRDMKLAQDPVSGNIPHIVPWPIFEEPISPAWCSAYPLVVWYLYEHTGDRHVLEEHYESIKRYVAFLGSRAKDFIMPPDAFADHESIVEGWKRSQPLLTSTFYYYYDARIVARVAALLGRSADAESHETLAGSIRDAFNKTFFNRETHTYGGDTQCDLILPLLVGLEPEGEREKLLERLVNKIMIENHAHVHVGILGAKYVLDLLMAENRPDVIWAVINRTDFPGLGNMVQGRTTLSESWFKNGTNNHVMWGHIDAWFYRVLAGIRAIPEAPGYERVRIQPYVPDDLQWVSAAIRTPRGRVASAWKCDGKKFRLDVTIPVNVTAELRLPAAKVNQGRVFENGTNVVWDRGFRPGTNGVLSGETDREWITLLLGSGCYRFSCDWGRETPCDS